MRQCSVNTAHCRQVSFPLRGPQWASAQWQNGEAPDWLPLDLQRCERPSFRFLRTSPKRPAPETRIVISVLVHSAMRNAQNTSHSTVTATPTFSCPWRNIYFGVLSAQDAKTGTEISLHSSSHLIKCLDFLKLCGKSPCYLTSDYFHNKNYEKKLDLLEYTLC